MLFLDSLGYYRIFTAEFHALQLIVLTVFGASCVLVHFLDICFEMILGL